ncbi:hypothetical protein QQF64_006823, partial [Cirrhinus molitorella]
MSDNDLKTHPLAILICDNGEPSLSATVSIDVVVVESTGDVKNTFRHAPIKEESFSDLNLYLLIAIVCVSVIFLLSLISLIAAKCHRTDSNLGRYSAPMITTHPDGSWSYSKSTQQYDVCFSSDTLKSDVVVFPAPFPPADAELISINGGDTFTRTQTLPNKEKIFDIDPNTGAITVKSNLDFEQNNAFEIRAQASDKGQPPMSTHCKVLVEVLDINDNEPEITVTSLLSTVKEDASIGTAVALVSVIDRDGGKNGMLLLSLLGREPPLVRGLCSKGQGRLGFAISMSLQKQTDSSLGRYSAPMITTHPDGSWSYSKSTQQYDVCFSSDTLKSDVVVFPAPFPPADAELISINGGDTFTRTQTLPNKEKEGSPKGTMVGLITVKDDDSEDLLDRENKSDYNVTITATDEGTPPLSSTSVITVHVSDVNDNAPRFPDPVIKVYVKENSQTGAVIHTISAFDPDIATDEGTPPLSSTSVITVSVSDVNDNVPRFSEPIINIYVKENSQIGAVIHTVSAFDRDVGDVKTPFRHAPKKEESFSDLNLYLLIAIVCVSVIFLLSLISLMAVKCHRTDSSLGRYSAPMITTHPDGSWSYSKSTQQYDVCFSSDTLKSDVVVFPAPFPPADAELISINGGDTFTRTQTLPNKEKATDSGVPPLSSNVTVNVFILDENDNSPGILAPYSELGSVNTENIPYFADAGYFVAKIRAVDADSGYNALLSYHISEPKANNLFRIGTSSGEIRTKRRMSDNDLKTHPLVILVCDNGEPSLSATVSIDVVVVESAGDVKTPFRNAPIKEESFSDLNLYLLIAIVCVSVIFLLSLISLIAVKCHRTDSSLGRYSAPMITTHPDGSWSYSKSTQQYDVCFSSDTLKSDVVVFPAPFPPADAELISINGGDTFTRTQTLPNKEK